MDKATFKRIDSELRSAASDERARRWVDITGAGRDYAARQALADWRRNWTINL